MWLRRAFYGWLIPAAVLLPLWLVVGLILPPFEGAMIFWLIVAVPVIFFGQLILTFLVRARGTVRAHRAVSWWDVLGFTVWHALIVALGFYEQAWWAPVMIAALVVGVALFWLTVWQLLREAKPSAAVFYTSEGVAYVPPAEERPHPTADPDVIVLTEIRDADKQ